MKAKDARKIVRAERAYRRARQAVRREYYIRPASPRFAALSVASARAWAHLQRARSAAGLPARPFVARRLPAPIFRMAA